VDLVSSDPDGRWEGGVRILLELEALSKHYPIPPGFAPADSPSVLRFVLDQDPELARNLTEALYSAFPDHVWSSPGGSEFRKLLGWVLQADPSLSRVEELPDKDAILEWIAEARRRVSIAAGKGAYRRHHWPDAPEALRRWNEDGHRLSVFSRTRPLEDQELVMGTVAPNLEVELLGKGVPDFGALRPQDDPLLLVLDVGSVDLAPEADRHGIPTAIVDRQWSLEPYRVGPRYFVPDLGAIDPAHEASRARRP